MPRKPKRFMEAGVAWNCIAMDQAIRDAGLERDDVVNERTGIIVALWPVDVRDREICQCRHRERTEEDRPFEVPKAMCSGPSAVLATSFEIKGRQLLDFVGLRDLRPLSAMPPR